MPCRRAQRATYSPRSKQHSAGQPRPLAQSTRRGRRAPTPWPPCEAARMHWPVTRPRRATSSRSDAPCTLATLLVLSVRVHVCLAARAPFPSCFAYSICERTRRSGISYFITLAHHWFLPARPDFWRGCLHRRRPRATRSCRRLARQRQAQSRRRPPSAVPVMT